jgi:hypothetical protein
MSPQSLNLIIYEGDTFSHAFQLMHSLRLKRVLNDGDTKVYTSLVTAEIPQAEELIFQADNGTEVAVITAAIAPVGASQIPIAPYHGGAMPAGAIAETLPQDITGSQCRGQIRRSAGSEEVLADLAFEITPQQGLIRLLLSPSAVALPANCECDDLPSNDRDLADPKKFKNNAWAQAYQMDFELIQNAVVQTMARGRIWVPRGVTR